MVCGSHCDIIMPNGHDSRKGAELKLVDDDKIKLAFTTLACPDWTLEEIFERGAEYGYKGIEIESMDGHRLATPQMLKDNAGRIRRLSETSGCRPLVILSHVQLAKESIAERTAALSEAQAYLELLGDLGVDYLRVMGNWALENPSEEWLVDTVADGLGRLAEVAEKSNTTVALETHDCFRNARALRRVLEQVNSPRVVALWDTQHTFRGGQSVAEVWSHLSEWVVHVHVKDARRTFDAAPPAESKPQVTAHDVDAWEAVPMGEGEIPVKESIRTLIDAGYDGFISYEWERQDHPELPAPEVELPAGAAKIREYLGEVSG